MANDRAIRTLGVWKSLGLVMGAAGAFTLAYAISWGGYFMVGFLFCLFALAKYGTTRQVFYLGLATGMLIYSINLFFFYTIFQAAAIVFWLILSFILALFLLTARFCFAGFKPVVAAMVIPFVWTGFEYFRSELYYLRFSWANVGYAFSRWPVLPFGIVGVYGAGFLMSAYAIVLLTVRRKKVAVGVTVLSACALVLLLPAHPRPDPGNARVRVAGVQLESPMEHQVFGLLNQLQQKFPETDLFVLSEYAFDGPVPDRIKRWCREHQRYLIAGGKEPAANGNYYNTAFVIGTNGEVAFKQVKSVPVQFFKDGMPAQEQNLWASPWGKIGICLCYDFSYARVTDRLIRLGAQAMIVPTGDLSDWGVQEHELHSRVAPVRAAEYGIPIFRLSCTGVSQLVNRAGEIEASAPSLGQFATISGALEFGKPGRLPLDRILAPLSVLVTVAVVGCLLLGLVRRRPSRSGTAG